MGKPAGDGGRTGASAPAPALLAFVLQTVAWRCQAARPRPVALRLLALTLLALALLAPQRAFAQARLRVLTTTSDLRSLVEAVAGDRVQASHLAAADADVEQYQPRPQDLARLRDAALVVRVGADFDLWFDALVKRSGRADLRRGAERHVDASLGIALLEVRGAALGAGDGHAHGAGNPHYWLDPANAEIITATLLEALARLDPPNAQYYEARRIAFLDRLQAKRSQWDEALKPLRGRPLIAHHNTWAYFARRFRLNFVGFIEPRPGVPASPAHLDALAKRVRQGQVALIVRQPHESPRNADFLAAQAPAGGVLRVAVLAASVGAVPQAVDYIALFDHNVRLLSGAP